MTNTVVLPWPPKELNPNWTGKLRDEMRAIKSYRETCYYLAKKEKLSAPKSELIRIHLEFYTPTRAILDDDNLIGYFKRGRDGVAKAVGVDDRCFRTQVDHIGYDVDKKGKVVVRLEAVE